MQEEMENTIRIIKKNYPKVKLSQLQRLITKSICFQIMKLKNNYVLVIHVTNQAGYRVNHQSL